MNPVVMLPRETILSIPEMLLQSGQIGCFPLGSASIAVQNARVARGYYVQRGLLSGGLPRDAVVQLRGMRIKKCRVSRGDSAKLHSFFELVVQYVSNDELNCSDD
jgi:hypothetical protein